MVTELGKILKKICVDADIKQREMAKSLKISTGKLSAIMTGKTVPDMDLLGKCIDRYQLKGKDIKDIFSSAFVSTAKNNHTIVLDVRHFRPQRVDWLIKIFTLLLLQNGPDDIHITLTHIMKDCYRTLDTGVEYTPPSYEESDTIDC
jgi:transcriptional regulator with XRE-family HTH domain